mgnify:FL=1
MLVQTSVALAFSNVRVAASAHTEQGAKIGSAIYNALRTKVGTIKVDDKINLTRRTFLQLREQGNLPAYMMQ